MTAKFLGHCETKYRSFDRVMKYVKANQPRIKVSVAFNTPRYIHTIT